MKLNKSSCEDCLFCWGHWPFCSGCRRETARSEAPLAPAASALMKDALEKNCLWKPFRTATDMFPFLKSCSCHFKCLTEGMSLLQQLGQRERENMWKKNRLMSMDCNSQDNNPSPGQHKEETDMDGNEALPDIGGSVLSLGLVSGKEETLINLFHLDSNGQLIALVLTSVCRHCHFKAWSFGRVRRKLTMLEPWTIKLFVSGLPTRTLLWLYRCLPVHCITARYCQTAMAQACTNSRKCKKEWLPAFSDVPVFTPDNVRAWARLDMYSICSSQRMTTSGFRPLPSATFRTLAAS